MIDDSQQLQALSTLVNRHGIGLVWMDASLRIVHLTDNVPSIMGLRESPIDALATTVFDEMRGMDDVLVEVIDQKRDSFAIELIEKNKGNDTPYQVAVTFYPLPRSEQTLAEPALLMVCEKVRVGDLIRKLSQHYVTLRLTNEEIQDAIWIDPLTNLGNRHALEHEFARLAIENARSTKDHVIVAIEVDEPTSPADESPNAQKEQLVRTCARVLKSNFRQMGSVYRRGGNEFVVIITASSATLDDLKKRFDLAEEQIRAKGFPK
jgi:GGDEF domain-containing protein